MKVQPHIYSCLLVSFALLIHTATADNGFYPSSFGSNGLVGGAGTALPVEATNVEANPALLSQMCNHWFISPGMNYHKISLNSSSAPFGNHVAGNQKNSLPYSPFGLFGFCYRPNECWAIGLGTAGAGTLQKFDRSISFTNSKFNRQFKLAEVLINPTIAYNVSCNQSYGLSLIIGASQIKTDLALSNNPFVETKGNDLASYTLGIGARIGGFWTLTDYLNIGASLSSPVFFQKNTRYSDVLPNPQNLPAIARIGVDFHLGDCTHILIDFKEIFYKEVKAFGSDLGWKNQPIIIIGIKQRLTCDLTGCFGYNYGRSPIREDNILLNGLGLFIVEHHFAGGFEYRFNPCIQVFLGGIYTLPKTLTDNGTGKLGPGAKGTIGKAQIWGSTMGITVNY